MQQSNPTLIELNISRLSRSREQTRWEKFFKGVKVKQYAVVLERMSAPEEFMALVVGETEAQLLVFALEVAAGSVFNKKPARFLHDTLKEAYERFGYHLEKVIIDQLVDSIFSATMYFKNGDTVITEIGRASDALTIAVKCKKPIYVTEDIFIGTQLQ
jgi:bifunctional DNase/RNase